MVRWSWVNFKCRGVLQFGGGAMVLGKFQVPGRPTYLCKSRARACCAGSRCGWGLDIFSLVYHFSFLSPCLWETAQYRPKYCLKGTLSPEKTTNQPTIWMIVGQGPIALAVGAAGGCLDIFTPLCPFSPLSP